MREKKEWDWRKLLAIWNFSLSLFSFVGTIRTAPQLFYNLATLSFRDNVCRDPLITHGSGSCGLWIQLFVLSKFPELIDTVFVLVHKKKLIFLHWYHHMTVLLYCWHSYASESSNGLFFVVMNYFVHSIMYGYYFLTAMKLKPKWLHPIIITIAQIAQMVGGVFVTAMSCYYHVMDSNESSPCHLKGENNIAALFMYGSYLFLFVEFFVKRYSQGRLYKRFIKTS